MNIKLLLLMNCVIVANCQSTSSKRNDAEYECEVPIDTKSEMESIRQLLMNLQQAMQEMKLKTDEIRQLLFKQHGNETQTMQEMKLKTDEIRQLLFKQHGNETQTMLEMKSRLEEIRQETRAGECKKNCPPGFDYLQEVGSCYGVLLELMTWDNAIERCRQVMPGVHLAAITSKDENDAVVRYLRSKFSGGNLNCRIPKARWPHLLDLIWISGQTINPRQCSRTFVWRPLRGIEIPFNYTNWHYSYPDCYDSVENCVHYVSGRDYKWGDFNCGSQSCAICELHV